MDATSSAGPFEAPACSTEAIPVAWRVHAEVVLILGWGAAILMQFAHPLVAAAVWDHSVFHTQPDGHGRRLRRTLDALLALTFGAPAEAARVAAQINAVHRRAVGRLGEATPRFPAGTPYAADDPQLLRWVYATLLDTFLRTYELFVGPLSAADRARYCAEVNQLARLLGIPDALLFTDVGALRAYLDATLADGTITVTETARRLSRAVLAPAAAPWAAPLCWLLRLPAVGLLPPALRRAYGFAWTPGHSWALALLAVIVRHTLPRLPAALRSWPVARAAYARRCPARAASPLCLLSRGSQR
jgi:uncharacterized protein (DUF2236 family)